LEFFRLVGYNQTIIQTKETALAEHFKRLLFLNVNKYQQQVLFPALLICLLACVGTIYAVYYITYIDKNIAVLCKIDMVSLTHDVPWFMQLHSFNKIVPWLFFGLTTTLLIIVFWLYTVSNRLLGPTIRILRELDEIISGQRKDPIGTRPGDEFFEELVKRINQLINRSR